MSTDDTSMQQLTVSQPPLDLDQLMKSFHQGDPQAFKELKALVYDRLLYLTQRLTDNSEVSASIAHQALENWLALREHFTTIHDLRAYLNTTCRNQFYDYQREKEAINQANCQHN